MEKQSAGTNIFSKFIEDVVNDIFKTIMDYMADMFQDTQWITGAPEIVTMTNILMGISITLLVFLVMKQLLTVYILETSGDPDGDPMQLFVKASIALALITSQNFIFDQIMKVSDLLSAELLGGNDIVVENAFSAITNLLLGLTTGILVLIIVIMFVILIVKATWRAIELAFFRVLFSLFCVDLVTPGNEFFRKFINAYLVTTFGFIIQLLCFRLAINKLISGGSSIPIQSTLYCLVLLLFAIKLPNWLKEFAYSSGLGGSAARGASTAANLAMQASRFIKV